jgi:hypothetical protein
MKVKLTGLALLTCLLKGKLNFFCISNHSYVGPAKALSGSKDLTEKLLPAIAKMAQVMKNKEFFLFI